MKEDEEKKAVKILNNLGYEVKLSKPVSKKTFVVENDTLERFESIVSQENMKIKDAIGEALEDWMLKKKR